MQSVSAFAGGAMSRDPRLVLIACCLAMLSVGENSTAIMAALPAMTSSLRLGPGTVEWAVNSYLLAMLPAGLVLWLHPRTGGWQTNRVDWLGLGLLAFFMVMLISGLHALATARSAPQAAIVPLMLAAIAFTALLWAETRHRRPLLDFGLFSSQNFSLACLLAFLLMFDIMTLLLYYNLFAQAPDGLDMTAVAAGLSLMPLSVALFGFARAAPWLGAAIGLRRMMVGGSLLLALGCAIAWAS